MITGDEAREIAGPTASEIVDSLEPFIRSAAATKERCLRTGWVTDLPYRDFWVNDGYSFSPKCKEAQKILESNGFKVSFYYMELQFVDMYTLIEW